MEQARLDLLLGCVGQPSLVDQPRVQKWLVNPVLTQRALSLARKSAATRDVQLGRRTTKREADLHYVQREHTNKDEAILGKLYTLKHLSIRHL